MPQASLRFTEKALKKIDEIANTECLPRATMLKSWILQRLRNEGK